MMIGIGTAIRLRIRRGIVRAGLNHRREFEYYRRIAHTEIEIFDPSGHIVIGPMDLESLCIIWKYGGYSTNRHEGIVPGIELSNGVTLMLNTPKQHKE